jgi:hypothetical protein
MSTCSHLDQIKITDTNTHVCKECLALGDTWVHLRLCLECGITPQLAGFPSS